MPNINFLIKPSSSKCNIKCKYCFYHDVSDNRMVKDFGNMSEETVDNLIKNGLEYANGGMVSFAFQGGEPTLVGLKFYEKFVETVNKYNNNSKVHYAIQTNGMLINDAWAKFFNKNKFLVGLSLDGTKEVNDLNRIDHQEKGTFTKVMQAAKLFEKYNVEFNILTVVNREVVRRIRSIYKFFKKNNFKYLQFIPCLDPINETPGSFKYSLTPDDYGKFLKSLFDMWYEDMKKNETVSIRIFDNILGMYLGIQPESCDMVGRCSVQHVVEADGSVYPCDFYVLDEMKIGNVNTDTINEMHEHEMLHTFINESVNLSPKCKSCKWLRLCRGGCKRHRDDNDLNYFCEAYKDFYEYTDKRFRELAFTIRRYR